MASMRRIALLSGRATRSSALWQAQRGVQVAVLAEPHLKAVLVDAAGTLIYPSEPAAEVPSRNNVCPVEAVCSNTSAASPNKKLLCGS